MTHVNNTTLVFSREAVKYIVSTIRKNVIIRFAEPVNILENIKIVMYKKKKLTV